MTAWPQGHRVSWTGRWVRESWLYRWSTSGPGTEAPLIEGSALLPMLRSAPYGFHILAGAGIFATLAGVATGHAVLALLGGVFAFSMFLPRLALLGVPALFIWGPRLNLAVSGDEALFLRLDQAVVGGMLAYGVFHPRGSLRCPPGHGVFVVFLGVLAASALVGLIRGTLTTPVSSILYLGQWLELYAVYVLAYSLARGGSGWGFRVVEHTRETDGARDRVSGSPHARGRRLEGLVGGLQAPEGGVHDVSSRHFRDVEHTRETDGVRNRVSGSPHARGRRLGGILDWFRRSTAQPCGGIARLSREGGNPADSSARFEHAIEAPHSQGNPALSFPSSASLVYAWVLPLLALAAYGLAEAQWPYYEEPGVRYRTFERILFPGQANHAAGLFAFATVTGLALATTRRFRVLGIALAVLCTLALAPTGSRSGALAWLAGLGTLAVIALPPLRWWGPPLGVVALVAVPGAWWQRFAAPGSSMYDRLVAWKSALSTVDAYPLLGLGAGARHRSYYDNHYLMTLSESGLLGMLLLLLLLAVLARALANGDERWTWQRIGALAGLAALAVHALATATFIVTMVAGPFFWYCGIAMARRDPWP